MYYIRKLSSTSSLYKLRDPKCTGDICADFLGQDMRTSNDTLSVWRSSTLNEKDVEPAICAALLSSSGIRATQFLIIDSDSLKEFGICTDDSEPGVTAFKGSESLHTNLCDLTYDKIGRLIQIFRSACTDTDRTPKIQKDQFKKIIIDIDKRGQLDLDKLEEHMKKEVQKVLDSVR